VFADKAGVRVSAEVKDFVDVTPLGYGYDRLEPKPPGWAPAGPGPSAAALAVARTPERTPLDAARVTKTPVPIAQQRGAGARMASLAANRKLYLVLDAPQADAQPGTLYDVYLDLRDDDQPSEANVHRVGSFNFFDAVLHSHGSHAGHAEAEPEKLSFDVTKIARDLRAQNRLRDQPSVTIVRAGEAAAGANPSVGAISFVEG
jgi:hypothetical protein